MTNDYQGPERRSFLRLDYINPLAYKVCKKETISALLKGYTADVSTSGLRCKIKDKVNKDDIVWLSFDRATLHICEELENRALIYQNGIIGKVVWTESKETDHYDIGVHFITREEKNSTNIYPKIHFLETQGEFKDAASADQEEPADEENGNNTQE